MDPWIKMRCGLATNPKTILIADKTGLDRFSVVGRLHTLWAWADSVTENGNDITVTSSFIDELVSCLGFASALREAHWLKGQEGCLTLPKFEEHNGQSSKRRSVTADRVKAFRQNKTSKKSNAPGVTDVTPPLPLPLISSSLIPKLEEWVSEAKEKHPDWRRIDVEAAWHHYNSNGWKVGKNPVKIWRSCLATCYLNWRKDNPGARGPISSEPAKPLPPIPEPVGWQERLPAMIAADPIFANYVDPETPWYRIDRANQKRIAEFKP